MNAALSVQNVTKKFDRRFVRGGYTTFKTQLVQWLNRGKYREELERRRLHVLKGVSFDIMPGETVGIIGRNGAGKSTLLKLLTGIYKPSTGAIVKRGRISALLELGAGFHPEFSGRENIYMNGMILGLSKRELKKREQTIIDFSELGDFIDAPVRTYSSGMYMRLAFAIAVNVDPDILIIDEVLAVGDEHFQHKSKAKLDEFKQKNIAIVLVTHDLGTVESWCTRAIWLEGGKVEVDGPPRLAINAYRSRVQDSENAERVRQSEESAAPAPQPAEPAEAPPQNRWGDQKARITQVRVLDANGKECYLFQDGAPLAIEITWEATETVDDACFGIAFYTTDGLCLFGTNSQIEGKPPLVLSGTGKMLVKVTSQAFKARSVRLDVAISAHGGRPDHDYIRGGATLDFLSASAHIGIQTVPTDWHFGSQTAAPSAPGQATNARDSSRAFLEDGTT